MHKWYDPHSCRSSVDIERKHISTKNAVQTRRITREPNLRVHVMKSLIVSRAGWSFENRNLVFTGLFIQNLLNPGEQDDDSVHRKKRIYSNLMLSMIKENRFTDRLREIQMYKNYIANREYSKPALFHESRLWGAIVTPKICTAARWHG